jgi:glycerol-3-phosphate dehydrogenase (NAD(P)+)
MAKVAVIGNGTWGTALGIMLARKGNRVKLWTRTEEEAKKLNDTRENTAFLPGYRFPIRLSATDDTKEAVKGADMVILAVPAHGMSQNVKRARKYLKSMIIVSATKGLEVGSGKRMSQVIADEIDPSFQRNICVLSGPNIAQEAAQNLHSTTVIAAQDAKVAEKAREIISSHSFCVFTSSDVIGVELGGALKNVIALGAGIADGLGYGNNAKAAFITRGLVEVISLGTAVGANPLTFAGLACLGDIIATCFSPFSRNLYVGTELAKGRPLREIMNSMPHVAEGISTTLAARKLARKVDIELPITEQLYRVIYEGLEPKQAVAELIGHPTEEAAEIGYLNRLIAQYSRRGWQRLPTRTSR